MRTKELKVGEMIYTLQECQKVPELWITRTGCLKSRDEAERYAKAFKIALGHFSWLSRIMNGVKIRKMFMCGDCPVYGEPIQHFKEIVEYFESVQAATIKHLERIIDATGEEPPEELEEETELDPFDDGVRL